MSTRPEISRRRENLVTMAGLYLAALVVVVLAVAAAVVVL